MGIISPRQFAMALKIFVLAARFFLGGGRFLNDVIRVVGIYDEVSLSRSSPSRLKAVELGLLVSPCVMHRRVRTTEAIFMKSDTGELYCRYIRVLIGIGLTKSISRVPQSDSDLLGNF
jgi:hypothetical protein